MKFYIENDDDKGEKTWRWHCADYLEGHVTLLLGGDEGPLNKSTANALQQCYGIDCADYNDVTHKMIRKFQGCREETAGSFHIYLFFLGWEYIYIYIYNNNK